MRVRAVVLAVVAVLGVLVLTVAVAVIGSVATTGPGAGAGLACAPAEGPRGEFGDDRQVANAAAIVDVGVELGIPEQGQVVALATAMQESRLFTYANDTVEESLTLPHDRVGSDFDSVGVFQQRRVGWGSVAERMDTRRSATLFYEALLRVPEWESLSVTVAAQRVQISAFPQAYAQWEDDALQMHGLVSGVQCPAGGGGGAPDNVLAAAVIERATAQVGTPYVWGGGDAQGATVGVDSSSGTLRGFDCSGLMVHAFAAIDVAVPHQTQAIWARFAPPITDTRQLLAGDMLMFSDNGRPTGVHHVGLYLGDGRMVHAPNSDSEVRIEQVWSSSYWSGEFLGAVRAVPSAAPQGPAAAPPPQ